MTCSSRRRPRIAYAVAVATLVAFLAAGCSEQAGNSGTPSSPTPTTTATVTTTLPTPDTRTSSTPPQTPRAAAPEGTKVIVLRPFTAGGSPGNGWTVNRTADQPIDCYQANPSPSSTSPGILSCSPSAAQADACYVASGKTTALCLVDPFSRSITKMNTGGKVAYGIDPPLTPDPIGLILDDGTTCRLRDGGAWSAQAQHPNYVGYYSCGSDAESFDAVWADPNSQSAGIDKSNAMWSVQMGSIRGPITTHTVTTAYLVGVA